MEIQNQTRRIKLGFQPANPLQTPQLFHPTNVRKDWCSRHIHLEPGLFPSTFCASR